MINRERLSHFWAQPEFAAMREVLLKECPEIQEYAPGRTDAEWAFSTGLRAGYLLVLKDLGVKID